MIEAQPATMPVTAPTRLGLPYLIHSIPAQVSALTAADTCVTAIAMPALPFAASALPPLKPNQPTHSMAAPLVIPGAVRGDLLIGKTAPAADHQGEYQGLTRRR